MKIVLITILLLTLGACATNAKRTNKIELGMSKSEVINILESEPDETRAAGNQTFFMYKMKNGVPENNLARYSLGIITIGFSETLTPWTDYIFVFDETNKLKMFGKVGDFDTTRPETIRVISSQQ
ncbi:MAG: hypothetical protein AB7I27_00455 [Bacteriovoracaceae bacterium]